MYKIRRILNMYKNYSDDPDDPEIQNESLGVPQQPQVSATARPAAWASPTAHHVRQSRQAQQPELA